jgi:hypothetical protein
MFWMAATALIPSWSPHGSGKAATTFQFALLYGALYTIAVGTGGIKPNVSSFGADQFDDNSHVERKQKQSFFNWFYFSINVGSLIACTVIVSIQVCPTCSRSPGEAASPPLFHCWDSFPDLICQKWNEKLACRLSLAVVYFVM